MNEDQADELLALTSIYDGEMIRVSNEPESCEGVLYVDVEVPQPFSVAVKDRDGTEHNVMHLPCIVLTFTLHPDYPSLCPPNFTLTCLWLSENQLSLLTTELHQLWSINAGSVILFTWIGFLQKETLTFLNIKSPLMLSEDDLQIILDHDRTKRERMFACTMYLCQICFCEKLGSTCLKSWECDHVFCKRCLKDYFEVHIKDGTISLLTCPEVKCGNHVHPSQVKELVSAKLFERYDRLLLQKSLDAMSDVVYCPRKACGAPVLIDKDNAMGACAECRYVFCIYCQRVYHGVAPCEVKPDSYRKIRKIYLAGSESEKLELEKKHGKERLKKLVEEDFSELWMKAHSKKCPRCSAKCQKIDGCDEVTCSICQSCFCWSCLKAMQPGYPYDHYCPQRPRSKHGFYIGTEDSESDDESDNDAHWDAMHI